MKRTLIEALLVGVIGAAVAFAANALSSRGLKLTTDYFPGANRHSSSPTPVSANSAIPAGTNVLSNEAKLAEQLAANGLQLATHKQVQEFYHDPRKEQNFIVFLDARDDDHYQEGHIPGAYQFDHFHPENYLPTILPVCQIAEKIVVYCKGGDCEDSQHAAVMLRDSAGVPKEKFLIYGGGIAEWEQDKMPIETGVRNSGLIRAGGK